MDSVLVDTEHLWDEVREELTRRMGRPIHARGAGG
jgi:beta-phosphoglucomutase-like phosphatase (HAD superfamily)